jgi:hypothetical protein
VVARWRGTAMSNAPLQPAAKPDHRLFSLENALSQATPGVR